MLQRPTVMLCAATLLLGIVIGTIFESWPLTARVQADAWSHPNAAQLYDELATGSNPLVQGGQFLSKVARLTTPSVVHIKSERTTSRGGVVEETGSGVIVESVQRSGHFVVTNRHVIDGADTDDISVFLHDGRVLRPEQIWSDEATDVAVLKVTADGLQSARWANSDEVEIGHMVLAMGSPFGLSHSISYGIISAKGRRSLRLSKERSVLNQDFLQTDAAINPGNSGGPLIDMHGKIVGINTAIASNSGGNEGIGFSIPSNLVRRVADELLARGTVQRAYLGVMLDSDFNAETASRLKLDRARGARVVRVYDNTPAADANLQRDDVVLRFNGTDVLDENHLINLVSLTPVGSKVRLLVMRNGMRITLEVVLSDRSRLDQTSNANSDKYDRLVPATPMGLSLHRLDSNMASQLDFNESAKGLLVVRVDADSPLAGTVQLYDVIEEVGRIPVTSVEELRLAVDAYRSSDCLVLKLRRQEDGVETSHLAIWKRSDASQESIPHDLAK